MNKFNCFVVINPRVLSARVDFGLFCFRNLPILLPPHPSPLRLKTSRLSACYISVWPKWWRRKLPNGWETPTPRFVEGIVVALYTFTTTKLSTTLSCNPLLPPPPLLASVTLFRTSLWYENDWISKYIEDLERNSVFFFFFERKWSSTRIVTQMPLNWGFTLVQKETEFLEQYSIFYLYFSNRSEALPSTPTPSIINRLPAGSLG